MRRCGCYAHNGLVLSPEGLAQREVKLNGVDSMQSSVYIDSGVSVSGLELERDFHVFDDEIIDSQYRRFHNGS